VLGACLVPVWFLGGSGGRVHQIRLLGATLASQVCGVLSDEVLVGATHGRGDVQVLIGVARAVMVLSGWMRLSARLRICASGHWPHWARFCASAGGSLSSAAGWFRATTRSAHMLAQGCERFAG
jgi:hypothetical protein